MLHRLTTDMKTCLIVCYSRTGATEAAASALARASGADVEALQPQRGDRNACGFLRACCDAVRGVPAPIASIRHNPADYPFVVPGTPVWAGHVSAPMRSHILQQHHFHRVAMFCTMGGRGGEQVLSEMAILSHREPFARLCLREQERRTGGYLQHITDFTAEPGWFEDAAPTPDRRAGRRHRAPIAVPIMMTTCCGSPAACDTRSAPANPMTNRVGAAMTLQRARCA